MFGLSDPRHFRRLLAAYCLIAAPVVLLIGATVHPQSKDVATEHLAVVADNPARYYVAHAILLAGLVLLLPALLGIMHLLRERATAFGLIGGGLAMIGLFGAASIVAVDGITISQMGQPQANVEEMAALLDRIKESAGLRAIAVVGAVSFLVGMLLLAYGVWREKVVQPLVAGLIAAAAITFFVGQVIDNQIIFAIAFAIYLIGFGLLGRRILAQSDEEWALVSAGPAATPVRPSGVE